MTVLGGEGSVREVYAFLCGGSQCYSLSLDICLLVLEG